MLKRALTYAVVVTMIGCTPALAAGRNINKRQARQQNRIYQGIASGSLTRQEAARLERQEGRIDVREARDRRNGLSPRERTQLERSLNRESRQIYRQKHDKQNRG
ncbi:MAG TPA: hypothetical protein VL484_19935 [Vicinamibacterales bacterium]|jgi:hypothetical protein|nr:hypothetical protein [Vicinamibacterales bacterium]